MAVDRYVVLGLARPRAAWFRSVATWATGSALPAEFVKCLSAEELRARLASGRPFSAVLVDGGVPAVDRDLIAAARAADAAVLVVDEQSRRDWSALGAHAVLAPGFGRAELLDALATHAVMVGAAAPAIAFDAPDPDVSEPGGLVAVVCGPGGTGVSTAAAALAQGIAARSLHGSVLLADLCLHAEQAMLHDVHDVVPGVQELVEGHRSGRPSSEEVRALTFDVVDRDYHLLLGLRRARYWSTLRTRAVEASIDSLRRAFGVVVADVTADFEGEADGGSADVEERNVLARTALHHADVVVVVGAPGVKGVHSLVRVITDAAARGVAPERIVPVLNQAPRHPRARAELARAVTELVLPEVAGALASPVFLPRRRVELALRDAVRLPAPLPDLLAGAFDAVVRRNEGSRLATATAGDARPERIAPGSLGHWGDQHAG